MNAFGISRYAAGWLAWLALAVLSIPLCGTASAEEEKFDVLQIGTQTYSNVTVTTKAKHYVFLLHSSGLVSIKVSQLPPELLEKLGYVKPAAKVTTNAAVVWAKQEIAKVTAPQVASLSKQWSERGRSELQARLAPLHLSLLGLVLLVFAAVLLLYLFQCYCLALICRKTGNPGGIMVWVPVLQVFPLLRAAGMSYWWFVGLLIPVLNVVASVLWCFKIAKARGKSVWVGVLLLLPVTSLLAFLYLAFSNGIEPEKGEEVESKLLTLQSA